MCILNKLITNTQQNVHATSTIRVVNYRCKKYVEICHKTNCVRRLVNAFYTPAHFKIIFNFVIILASVTV